MALYNYELNALYIHNPKAYGTSISNALRTMDFNRIFIHRQFNEDGTLNTNANNQNTSPRGVLQRLLENKYIIDRMPIDINNTFIFTFVRNPYDRFLSGCNFTKKKVEDVIGNEDSLNNFQKYHITIPQSLHIYRHSSNKDISHINFIGNCGKIDDEWKLLETKLRERGWNHQYFTELNHLNKSEKINDLTSSDPIITEYVDQNFQDDLELWNQVNTTN